MCFCAKGIFFLESVAISRIRCTFVLKIKVSIMRLRHFLLLSLTVVLCACPCKKGNEDVENEPAELLWETSALSIIEQIAPDDSLCYQIDLTLDTLAGDSLLARNLAAVLRDSVLLKPRCVTVEEAMKAFLSEPIIDGRTFWELESDLEWTDGPNPAP